jgi:hypothetical protein
MQIIISVMVIGLLWMIYDIVNAPEVDDNENPLYSDEEATELMKEDNFIHEKQAKKSEVSEVED